MFDTYRLGDNRRARVDEVVVEVSKLKSKVGLPHGKAAFLATASRSKIVDVRASSALS